ncbi:MAG: CapA family protein [Myxococcaceae bacterium]|nr:CapA family protein [Myxococcaceae bacterium]MCI0672127.1 CapA family protein [Myxococcaceae bacterium]
MKPLPSTLLPDGSSSADATQRLTLAAVGDILFQGAIQSSVESTCDDDATLDLEQGYTSLFAPIGDELSAPDLLFANLETPIAPRDGEVRAGSYSFNAPVESVSALRAVGLDVVSVANNHIFDRGRRGLVETLAHLEAQGLAPVGAAPSPRSAGPRILEARGIRVAFLAWTQLLNRDFNECAEADCPEVAVLRAWAPAEAAVREAAAQADAVVVSLHWGREYESAPGPGERTLARRLCDAGARIVLGHHPHVLQPLEFHRGEDGAVCLIAYSLGNFISNQARHYVAGVRPAEEGDARDGMLLRVELARRPDPGAPAVLTGVDVLPLWTEHLREPGDARRIRIVALERALTEVREAMDSTVDAGERRSLRRREALYLERLARIRARVGAEYVRAPASQ